MENNNNTLQNPIIQGNIPEFKVLTDIVKLPSKGKFYTGAMANMEEIYVEQMTAKDENLLLTPGLLRAGTAFNMLLKRKIKNPNVILENLLICDQNAILLFLRCSAYGPMYDVTVINPATQEPFQTSIDLNSIEEKQLTVMPDENGEFPYTTKDGKKIIKFKLLTVGQEENINAQTEARSKIDGINNIITERLKHQITELDGNREKGRIASFIDTMPIYLSREIRRYIDSVTPGLSMETEVTSPTGDKFRSFIPISSDFFYPA